MSPKAREKLGGIAGQFLDGILPGTSGIFRGAREAIINAAHPCTPS